MRTDLLGFEVVAAHRQQRGSTRFREMIENVVSRRQGRFSSHNFEQLQSAIGQLCSNQRLLKKPPGLPSSHLSTPHPGQYPFILPNCAEDIGSGRAFVAALERGGLLNSSPQNSE